MSANADKRIGVPANDDYITWVDDLAEQAGLTKAGVIDLALRTFAMERGSPPPPPRTLPAAARRRNADALG